MRIEMNKKQTEHLPRTETKHPQQLRRAYPSSRVVHICLASSVPGSEHASATTTSGPTPRHRQLKVRVTLQPHTMSPQISLWLSRCKSILLFLPPRVDASLRDAREPTCSGHSRAPLSVIVVRNRWGLGIPRHTCGRIVCSRAGSLRGSLVRYCWQWRGRCLSVLLE